MKLKCCSDCHILKPLSEFGKRASSSDSHHYRCKSCNNTRQKNYRKRFPDKIRTLFQKWSKANPDRVREHVRKSTRKWRVNNLEKTRESGRLAQRQRRADPIANLHKRVSEGVRVTLKGDKGGRAVFSLLPYTIVDLHVYLEAHFQPGMTWDNYGAGPGKWHIDHCIPLSWFNISSASDPLFIEAWSLTNLQPMWHEENISKGDHRAYSLLPPRRAP